MSVICLNTYRDERRVLEIVRQAETEPKWDYAEIRERLRSRFGDNLPKHFEQAISKPQLKPYMYGDVSNVSYRKRIAHFNQPMPAACEVTAESCAMRGDAYILGRDCLLGIDEPFPWMDVKYRVTLEFLKSLPDGSKLEIITRSDLIAHDDYMTELKRFRTKITILCPKWCDDAKLREIEPGAPSKERRIRAADKLKAHGFNAAMEYHNIPKRRRKGGAA